MLNKRQMAHHVRSMTFVMVGNSVPDNALPLGQPTSRTRLRIGSKVRRLAEIKTRHLAHPQMPEPC
jgi:hypothetical protein